MERHWCDIRKGLVAVEKQAGRVRQGYVCPVTTKRTLEVIHLEKETAKSPNEV
jgi:ATP-dependent RNA circularization protein (DNA/RNA ligase family)